MEKVMRKIIKIDEDKCDGCGLCIPACEEGALQIVEGKARLVKDIYCDGLGNCLGECPQDAIDIIEREAEPFDEKAVEERLQLLDKENGKLNVKEAPVCCGGNLLESLEKEKPAPGKQVDNYEPEAELSHWPVQLHLVSPEARFFHDNDLLIAADCVPFAFADFHRKFLAGKSLVIGCPKLDDVEVYHQKLVQIFKLNRLKSITLLHMEVGCCFGLSRLVNSALKEADIAIPFKEIIIGVDGSIKE